MAHTDETTLRRAHHAEVDPHEEDAAAARLDTFLTTLARRRTTTERPHA